MSEFVGLFGHVADVKAVKSLGVCRVIIEAPIEQHKCITNAFWDNDVLLTLSDGKRYGFATSTQPETACPDESIPNGAYYQALYQSGFFHNPVLWRWAGSDGDYQAWVREQPSCVSGLRDWVDGVGRCEYAHVRRVRVGAGVGIKPEYSGVPLTHAEHHLQHQQGELALLREQGIETDNAATWFDKQVVKYRIQWIKTRLYQHFGVSSLKDVAIADFVAWAQTIGVFTALPNLFKIGG